MDEEKGMTNIKIVILNDALIKSMSIGKIFKDFVFGHSNP